MKTLYPQDSSLESEPSAPALTLLPAWGSGAWEAEMEMERAVTEAYEEALGAKWELGRLLLQDDEAGFEAGLAPFLKMSFSELGGQAFYDSDRDDAYHEETLADICAQRGLPRALRALLAAGLNPNEKTQAHGLGAIHRAARSSAPGAAECVKALLAAGVSVDEPANHGLTPLMAAACAGRQETVALLLSQGARASLVNHEGLDAEALARSRGRHEAAGTLRAWQEASELRQSVGAVAPAPFSAGRPRV